MKPAMQVFPCEFVEIWNESDKKEEGDQGSDHRTGRGNVNSSNLPEKIDDQTSTS